MTTACKGRVCELNKGLMLCAQTLATLNTSSGLQLLLQPVCSSGASDAGHHCSVVRLVMEYHISLMIAILQPQWHL